MRHILLLAAALVAPAALPAQSQWVLQKSTLTYHMSHPVHELDGSSTAAKGKGTCQNGTCSFLIAAPVNTFQSGDSNRDLHMVQTTRGAEFPMVVVRTTFAESEITSSTLNVDLDVQFAGQTAHYQQISFHRSGSGADVHITGTIPATCSDFKIDRPTFLTVPIKNEIPVKVDMTWRRQ
jgi:hypothetical protein